jgi:hypothetical protein
MATALTGPSAVATRQGSGPGASFTASPVALIDPETEQGELFRGESRGFTLLPGGGIARSSSRMCRGLDRKALGTFPRDDRGALSPPLRDKGRRFKIEAGFSFGGVVTGEAITFEDRMDFAS